MLTCFFRSGVLRVSLCILLAMQSFYSAAQLNTDGSYTLKKRDGSKVIYYPTVPDANGREIDTLSVEMSDATFRMFFRISDQGSTDNSKNQNDPEAKDILKMTNDNGTVTSYYSEYPTCNCTVDTLLTEMPDGSFKQYYTVQNENRNALRQDAIINAAKKRKEIDVYENTEVMPAFRGGKAAVVEYVKKNIRFNNNGKRYLGSFNIHFIVLANGKIENIKLDKEYTTPPAALEKELIRVLKNMPPWKPGTVSEKPVNVYYTLQMNLAI